MLAVFPGDIFPLLPVPQWDWRERVRWLGARVLPGRHPEMPIHGKEGQSCVEFQLGAQPDRSAARIAARQPDRVFTTGLGDSGTIWDIQRFGKSETDATLESLIESPGILYIYAAFEF